MYEWQTPERPERPELRGVSEFETFGGDNEIVPIDGRRGQIGWSV